MKTSVTFSILIWINASRTIDNEAELFARITVNQKRANFSLKRKVNIDYWDKRKARVTSSCPDARLINQYINQVKSKLFQVFVDLKAEEIEKTKKPLVQKWDNLHTDTDKNYNEPL